MKTILFITARSDHGGGPKHLFELMHYLHEREDFEIHCAGPASGKYAQSFKELAKSFHEIPFRRFSLARALALVELIGRENITFVHTHGFGAGVYGIFLRLMTFSRVRWFHTFHGFHPQGMKKLITFFIAKFASKLICVSRSEKEAVIKHFGERPIEVIPNGVETGESPQPNSSRKILGTLTRFDKHKGNDILIKQFAVLPPETELHIAGDGEERETLEELIRQEGLEERVILHGFVENPREFLRSIDVYVSASKGEGLPYAALEALAEGKPCLLSDVSGHVDLAEFVTLFQLNDPDGLAQNWNSVSSPDLQKFREQFDKNQCLEESERLYT